MSLEESLNRHAAAIEMLAKSIESLTTSAAALLAAAASRGAVVAPASNIAAGTLAQETAQSPAISRGPGRPRKPADAPVTNGAASPQPKVVSYDLVREAILTLSEVKGHGAAVSLLVSYNCKTGRDLKPDQYQGVLDKIREIDSTVVEKAEKKLASKPA